MNLLNIYIWFALVTWCRGDRYDGLRICIGDELVQKLANLKLFMVGCGAIGCELLKNYALLGISTGEGKVCSIIIWNNIR